MKDIETRTSGKGKRKKRGVDDDDDKAGKKK
jgi:hypothetical protein